jgi:hypothetical protein
VRGSAAKTIVLHNPSSTPWQLHPSCQHEAWSGPEFLAVPAGGRAEYQVTYRPLAMTDKERPHSGALFFPIPDGTGECSLAAGPLPPGRAALERLPAPSHSFVTGMPLCPYRTPKGSESRPTPRPAPPLPGLLYSLVGHADVPVPEACLERSQPAKESLVEVLRVRNWLPTPQRFRLCVERRQVAPATSITGALPRCAARAAAELPGLC